MFLECIWHIPVTNYNFQTTHIKGYGMNLQLIDREKINSLTGIRFIAAYMVLISHIFGGKSLALSDMGEISVQLFFVLSGFVMYLNYADKIKIQQISFKKFMLLRLFRLYPVYFLSLTLYLLLRILLHLDEFFKFFKFWIINVAMIQSWFLDMNIAFSPINLPSWSVSDEIFFYLAFFIIVSKLSCKKILYWFIFYSCLWILLIFILKGNNRIPFMWLWYVNPLYRVCDFFAGYFVGYLFVYKKNYKKYFSFLQLNIFTLSMLEISLLIILFGSQFAFPLDLYWWFAIITQLISAFVIYVFAFNRGIFAKFLSATKMILLGEASYSLYLIHFVFLFVIVPYLSRRLFVFPLSLTSKLIIVTSELTLPVFFSILLYKFYEAPLYKFLKNKMK